MALTYSAPALAITLEIISASGVDPEPLLQDLGIDKSMILDPGARYKYTQIDELWYKAASLINDDSFGLKAAEFWHPSQLGALGYAWLSSSSMRTAMKRFARYMRILTEGATLQLEETATDVSLILGYRSISRQQPTRTDSFMAMLVAMCRANCGEDFHPESVSFTHPEPENMAPFYSLFRCPVFFDAKDNRFTLSSEVADRQLLSSNPSLALLNDQVILETISRMDKDNLVERVKLEIISLLPSGKISDQSVADSLHMNVRTLQRKLHQEGSSFKSLLNEVRKDLAKKYIRDKRESLGEIAFNLGFAESSSFSRAFKRWTGQTPSEARDSLA